MNIVLIGFASCGKSVTAAALCGLADMRHVDLDRVVEERYEKRTGARLSVRQIFGEIGSGGFTALENDALKSLSGMGGSVLSTGGRPPMGAANRECLKSIGRIVYLKCGVDAVIERMKNKGAPLTMGSKPEEIRAELEKRDPVYAALADIAVDNESVTPEETAAEILRRLA
ncbi:shikimate kinase [Fibrobacteres bacterium R8-0-B4]